MVPSSIRVLLVDDYEPWRRFASSTLQKKPGVRLIGEVADGLQAVQKSEELRPDLILLDIGLPTINGIEAARRIREHAPGSKILFFSEERSADVVQEALQAGATGYVLKSDAALELLPAVEAVLQGEQFVSSTLAAQPSIKERRERVLVSDVVPNGLREPSRETLKPWMLPVPGVRTYRNRESLLIAASSGVLPVPVFPV